MSERKRIMYLRNEEGNPKGVMVALETENETLRFGMAVYHPTKEDLPFTKKKAKEIAFKRATKCSYRLPYSYSSISPSRVHTIRNEYENHVRYFAAQAMKRLGVSRFENLFDPILGHLVHEPNGKE